MLYAGAAYLRGVLQVLLQAAELLLSLGTDSVDAVSEGRMENFMKTMP